MASYVLTVAAKADLRSIIEYTLSEWGEKQLFAYRDRLERRLDVLATFPEIGRAHVCLPDYVFYVVEGKHYVFYRIADDGIIVLRFIHYRMDIIKDIISSL